MNIAISLVNMVSGGTEFQMCLLADGLIKRGHNVVFYLTEGDYSGKMLSQFQEFRRRVSNVNLTSCALRFFRRILEWRRWMLQDEIDVAIGGLAMPHLILANASIFTSIPVIGRRGLAWEQLEHLPIYERAIRYLRMVRRWTVRSTKLLVCNTNHVSISAESCEGWPQSKIRVIRNGWPEYDPVDWSSTQVVYSAKNRPEKLHDALTRNLSGRLNVTFDFDVPDWNKVGVYIHPSMAEGLSNSIGMAMAHAIPVVAFDCAGNRELMGGTGFLVKNGDYDSVAIITKNLIDMKSTRVNQGLYGFERIRSLFPLKLMVDQWESLLTEVAAK